MELTQQRNSFSTADGRKRKPTLDFLSLCSHSSAAAAAAQQQDPSRPSSSQGVYLKTHDFLQPLERGSGRPAAKEDTEASEVSTTTTTPKSLPPQAPQTKVEHILPGGIGTYSISHISYYNNNQQRVPKPEGSSVFAAGQTSSGEKNEENSNCSSYTGGGSGFTLWEESGLKKGKTGKENFADRSDVVREPPVKTGGQWTTSERPSQSSTNHHSNHFSSLSPPDQPSGLKRRSFMEMMKSAKGDEDLDDDEDLIPKKESPPAELIVKVDGKSSDQKANTPRSKHSATEQRRRSKINDRFQMLREIIPHGDQKRDKASFLLEVIEYIQFLHEKVHKYEGSSYQGWNLDPEIKLSPWKSNNRTDESHVDAKKVSICTAAIPGGGVLQNPADSDTSSATTPKAAAIAFPMFNPARAGCSSASPQVTSDVINGGAIRQASNSKSGTRNGFDGGDKLKEHGLNVDGGTISISSAYSRGLVSRVTEALRSLGVDLSEAKISVEVEVGKGSKSKSAPPSITNKGEREIEFSSNQRESNQFFKKLKTG